MILNNIEYPENISNPEGFTNIEIINDMQILLQSVQNKLKFLNEELFKLNLL
jgi:hypothetical protein